MTEYAHINLTGAPAEIEKEEEQHYVCAKYALLATSTRSYGIK